jgi:hypothetical protein
MAEFEPCDGLAGAALCLFYGGTAGHQKAPVSEPNRHGHWVIHHYRNHLDVLLIQTTSQGAKQEGMKRQIAS